MTTEIIFQVIVGLGMIGGMWRLTREVAALTATMKGVSDRADDDRKRIANHSTRLRALELEVARGRQSRIRRTNCPKVVG